MRLEIENHFTGEGREYYYWTLRDGPDGIDEIKGFATDLIEVFSKVIEWRERIAADYITENNETD